MCAHHRTGRWIVLLASLTALCLSVPLSAWAQEDQDKPQTPGAEPAQPTGAKPSEAPPTAAAGPTVADLKVMADTAWVLVTAMLVFFMNLGFACVESGFCRAKNCVNILSKNFIVFAISSIGFWFLGWGLMFGGGSKVIGQSGLWI